MLLHGFILFLLWASCRQQQCFTCLSQFNHFPGMVNNLPFFFCKFFFNLFFYWSIIVYRILLFPVKPQHESAIGKHISPPFWTSLPSPTPSHPSRLIQSPCFEFSEPYSKIPLAIYFTYGNVSFHVTPPYISPSPPSPQVHKSILYVCFSIVAL